MFKKFFNIILIVFLYNVEAQQVITEKMLEIQEELYPDKDEIKRIEEEIRSFLDTTSVEKIKKRLEDNYRYYLDNKDTIIKILKFHQKNEDDRFLSITKSYKPSEEKFDDDESVYEKLVNNNHLNYRDTVQSGAYFDQFFKDNTSFLKTSVRNNGATVYKFRLEQTIQPYYSLNFDSEKELKIMNIYYNDGTVNSIPTSIPSHSFPLNSIPVDQMKHVDSLQMEFKIKYVSKIDSIHFKKSEIGVKKGKFKLLKMEKNYVEYETPNDYYPYHVGSVLKKIYFNKEGKVLENRFSIDNCSTETVEETYKDRLGYNKTIFEHIQNSSSKKQLLLTLKYLSLKQYNASLKKTRKNRVTLKGNVDAFTLNIEKRRDTLTFLTTLRNASSVRRLYVHELENNTEFINKNGKVITSIPSSISFLYSLRSRRYSDIYFFTKTENKDKKTYYYLNRKTQTIERLPYSKIEYLCPSILIVKEKNKEGFRLLSTKTNRLLSDKTFTRFFEMRYTGEGITLYSKEGNYLMYDQSNKLITSTSEEVEKITLKETTY